MIYDEFKKLTDENRGRTVKSVIGISRSKFDILVPVFAAALLDKQQEQLKNKKIKRIPSGGLKGHLDTPEIKLFFTLLYLKTYPTFDMLGFLFGLSSGHAHNHLDKLLPILRQSLSNLDMLPARTPGTPEEFAQLIEQYDDIAIDGLECACVRPQDKELQEACYSGKKKRHTLKALTITTLDRRILFLFCFFAGSVHDYTLMKMVFDPKSPWFYKTQVWLDLGFYGADKDYGEKSKIHLPHKRPRKSRNNPHPQLTAVQVNHNRQHARTRVFVEHAIGGMKSFHCLTHRIRNHLESIIDSIFWIPAGLWNLKIS